MSRQRQAAAGLWVDPVVHAAECVRFDGLVVNGPQEADCAIWAGAIGADGYGLSDIRCGEIAYGRMAFIGIAK